MAINTISEVAFSRATWLDESNPSDATKVDIFVCQSMFSLQTPLNKTDVQVEDELQYTSKEKLLVGLYTAYNLVCEKATENVAGANGEAATGNKLLKRAKADVTEAEFGILKESDGANLSTGSEGLMNKLKEEICNLARDMGISLPLCRDRDYINGPSDAGALPFTSSCRSVGCGGCGC